MVDFKIRPEDAFFIAVTFEGFIEEYNGLENEKDRPFTYKQEEEMRRVLKGGTLFIGNT